MASLEQGILDRFEQLVGTGDGKPQGLSTHRFPFREFRADEPVAVIYPVTMQVRRADLEGLVERVMTVRVRLHLGDVGDQPSLDGRPPDTIVDELYVWTVRRVLELDAFEDLDVDDIEETDSAWNSEETRRLVIGARAVDFRVTYFTDQDDPETTA